MVGGVEEVVGFSCQKSQTCTRGGGRSFWRRLVRISLPRAGELVAVLGSSESVKRPSV